MPRTVRVKNHLNAFVHQYDDAEWHVPEGFEFPRNVKIENGFNLWVCRNSVAFSIVSIVKHMHYTRSSVVCCGWLRSHSFHS